jgi:hypothetical protein
VKDGNEYFNPSEPDDMQLIIGKSFLSLSGPRKMQRLAGFRDLTSVHLLALLPWHIMCLSTLKMCTINLDVELCACGIFPIPESALIPPTFNTRTCHIEKLSAQVPIEILYGCYSRDSIFEYLLTLTAFAPHLQNLALHVARKERSGALPGSRIHWKQLRYLATRHAQQFHPDTRH